MRIVENSDARLRLHDRTLWIAVACFAAGVVVAAQLVMRHDNPKALIAVGACILFGLGFLRSANVVFDKAARTCAVDRLDVFRLTRRQLAFAEILDVKVDVGDGVGSRHTPMARLSLATADGVLPLTASYEPDLERHYAMRDTILGVLGREPAPSGPDDLVRAMVVEGRLMAAISLLRQREGLSLVQAKDRVEAIKAGEI